MQINYEQLIDEALKARKNSYSPYSNFSVGAAIQTEKGIYTGCNVENASFGLTNCAERTAIFKAVSDGAKEYKAIAICADLPGGPAPCGACRQVIREFSKDIKIIISDINKKYEVTDIETLLPNSFGPEWQESKV